MSVGEVTHDGAEVKETETTDVIKEVDNSDHILLNGVHTAQADHRSEEPIEQLPKPKGKPIIRYDEFWDMKTFAWKLRKSAKPERKGAKKDAVIVVRRRIDHKGRHFETVLDVYSQVVADILVELTSGIQHTKVKQTPPVVSLELLYHLLPALEEVYSREVDKTNAASLTVEHSKILIDFARSELANNISTLSTLFAAEEITWDLLWALYEPNQLVYHFHQLTEQHQLLQYRYHEIEKRQNGNYFIVHCDVINDDGVSFGLAKQIFEIKEFEGSSRIQDLTVFPLKHNDKQKQHLSVARSRAVKFAAMVGHQYQEVTGSAMREIRSQFRHEPREVRFFSFGKLIVDPKSLRLFVPDAEYNLSVYQRLERGKLTDDQLAICTPLVLGYCFGVKQWGAFAIDRCRDVVWQDDAFGSLVLNQSRKDLVYSLVRQHKKRRESFDDVVQGKGKGLIGLFSGKPGSGKTLTAESISQLTHQPLYTVSAGELGEKPQEVDEKLTMVLALAVTWDAIVLIDEADVFMQARDDNNVTRNALVSIFLRQLEYYEGILILTTNRIGNIDPAFESRIHFSFHYPDLDFAARKQIWSTFWIRAGADGIDVVILSQEDLSALAAHQLNGRQIKNTIASALSLALEEGVGMQKRHADIVLDVVEDWEAAVVV